MMDKNELKFSSEKNNLSFSVDGRMMDELGEKLVTNNYLALVELIKNAVSVNPTTPYPDLKFFGKSFS